MIIFHQTAAISNYVENQHRNGLHTGFVPTMGALHEGHISLIRQSGEANNITICSIFVNPTQFNNPADFANYPSTLEKDIDLLEASGCSALFLPNTSSIYPDGYKTIHYPLGYLDSVLEGSFRPGHFQGVCQVVDRLLQIIPATNLYLGQKDFQQCMVIRALIDYKKIPVKLHIGATIRESDGLAMSSRNMRLNAEERQRAVQIYRTLTFIRDHFHTHKLKDLQEQAIIQLKQAGFKIDYVSLCNDKLEAQERWDGESIVQALIAAYLNEVRLIDNMCVSN